MSLTLDPQTEQRIQRELARGHYTDAAQVIHRALDLLGAQEGWLLRSAHATYSHTSGGVACKKTPHLRSEMWGTRMSVG